MERNWRGWQQQKHWEKTNYWGVKGNNPDTGPCAQPQQQFRTTAGSAGEAGRTAAGAGQAGPGPPG